MTNKKISITHSIITILVALFFVNAGYKKFTSKKMKPLEKSQVVEYIFENDSYEAPRNTHNNGILYTCGISIQMSKSLYQ